jgi:hypothetical protein
MTGDPLVGWRLANFQIERLIGRGGMAQVYYGRDVKLKRLWHQLYQRRSLARLQSLGLPRLPLLLQGANT